MDDIRTLRFSRTVGYDLTPLIHFWGIHPANAVALRSKVEEQNLKASDQVRCLLIRYKSLIPQNNADFNAFFEKIYPGRPLKPGHDPRYGIGWYNTWRDKYNEQHGQAAQAQVDSILTLYYGAGAQDSCYGVATGEGDVARPDSFKWLGDFYGNADMGKITRIETVTF